MKVFKTISKKLLVYLLALTMLLTIAPMAALAADADEIPAGEVVEETLADDSAALVQDSMQDTEADQAQAVKEQPESLQSDETNVSDPAAMEPQITASAGELDDIVSLQEDDALKIGEMQTVSNQSYAVFTFTPDETAGYSLEDFTTVKCSITGIRLEDENGVTKTSWYEGDDGRQDLYCVLEKGKTYSYYFFADYDWDEEEFSYNFYLAKTVLPELNTEETNPVDTHEYGQWWSVTVPESAGYKIVTDYSDWGKEGGFILYDENLNSLESAQDHWVYGDDDEDEDESVRKELAWKFEEGKTYYLYFFGEDDGGFYDNISFEKTDLATVTFYVNHADAWCGEVYNPEEGEWERLGTIDRLYSEGDSIPSRSYWPDYDSEAHISFAGWSTDPAATQEDDDIIATDGLKLYAVWKQQYQVTFHINRDLTKAYFVDWNDDEERYIHSETKTEWLAEGEELYWHSEEDAQSYWISYENTDEHSYIGGWAKDKNTTKLSESLYVTGKMDVWAVWEEQHKVTFDTNRNDVLFEDNNSRTYENWFYEGRTIYRWSYDDFDYDSSKLEFLGWSTSASATEADDEIKVGDSDMTLFGVWKERFKVTYDANGGYYEEEDEDVPGITYRTYSAETTFRPLRVYTRDIRKTFAGWFDAETGGTQYTDTTKITKEVTLYAHWNTTTEEDITAGTLATASADTSKFIYDFTPAEDGLYVFNTADGKSFRPSVVVYDKDLHVVDPLYNNETSYSNYARVTELKKGVPYYFVITNYKEGAFSYNVKIEKVPAATVTFDLNRSGAAVDGKTSVTVQYPQGYTMHPDNQGIRVPNVGNFKLVGWSKDKNATESSYNVQIKKDTTLYGVWSEFKTVTFDANGGRFWDDDEDEPSLMSITETFYVGDTIDRRTVDIPSAPSGEDKYFAGWSKDENATEADTELTVTADLEKVYAVWITGQRPTVADAIDLTLDQETLVNSRGGGVYYRFVPQETGVYELYSYDSSYDSSYDPYVELYDDALDEIASNDDNDEDCHFDLSCMLEKGRTYYYFVRLYGGSATQNPFSYNIKLVKPVSTEVTFYANRADNLASFDGDASCTGTYVVGKRLSGTPTLYYPDDSGITFVGWSTSDTATEADGQIIAAAGMKLYAVWKKAVTVTFDTNGVPLEDACFWVWDAAADEDVRSTTQSGTFAEGEDINYYGSSPDYDDAKKSFVGWSTSKTATEADNNLAAKDGMTLYAVWKDRIVVTLDANGGYFEQGGVLSVKRQIKGAPVEVSLAPVNLDQTLVFAGWATTANAKEPNVVFEKTVLDQDTILYAVWKKGAKVTLHANGGSFLDDDQHVDTLTTYVLPGARLYDISGIRAVHPNDHKADSGRRAKTENGEALDSTTPITEAIDLYVLWNDRVKVTYDANGGTIYGEATDETWWITGSEQTISTRFQARPADANKAFAGWSTTKSESGIVTKLNPTKDTTLYAIYKDGYRVTLASANSEMGFAEAYVNGRTVKSYDENPTFLWAKGVSASAMNLDTFLHGDQEYIGLGFSTTKDEKGLISSSYTPAADTTLYAIFVPGYRVYMYSYPGQYSFDHYDGLDTGRVYSVRKGKTIGTITEPIAPDGTQLVGWINDEDPDGRILTSAEVADLVPTKNMVFRARYADSSTLTAVSKLTITVKNAAYTGKALEPAVTVQDGSKTLVEGSDYTVTYSNNKKVGTKAVATITGKGLYTGSINKTFSITKGKQPLTLKAKTVSLKVKNLKKKAQTVKASKAMTVSKAQGKVTYKLKSVSKSKFKKYFTVAKSNGKITVKKGLKKGTYTLTITVTAAGNGNYKKGAKNVTVKVKVK